MTLSLGVSASVQCPACCPLSRHLTDPLHDPREVCMLSAILVGWPHFSCVLHPLMHKSCLRFLICTLSQQQNTRKCKTLPWTRGPLRTAVLLFLPSPCPPRAVSFRCVPELLQSGSDQPHSALCAAAFAGQCPHLMLPPGGAYMAGASLEVASAPVALLCPPSPWVALLSSPPLPIFLQNSLVAPLGLPQNSTMIRALNDTCRSPAVWRLQVQEHGAGGAGFC